MVRKFILNVDGVAEERTTLGRKNAQHVVTEVPPELEGINGKQKRKTEPVVWFNHLLLFLGIIQD